MPSSSLLPTPVLLAVCLLTQGSAQRWDPLFDYTHLQPSNEEYWEPLASAKVLMSDALALAETTEGARVRLLKGVLSTKRETPVWDLQLLVGDAGSPSKRVDLEVSTQESKVLHRLELRSVAPDEKSAEELMNTTIVNATLAIDTANRSAKGRQDSPNIDDPRTRRAEFKAVGKGLWRIEVMGSTRREHIHRYDVSVNAQRPVANQRILLDRFVGEPLRSDKPTELDDGLMIFDFKYGDGQLLTADTKVKVDYQLFLLDSTKIHDTWQTHLPETFVVKEAPLKGMTLGMVGMRVGSRRKIVMPYPLAFGEEPNEIAPAKAMVVCDIQVAEAVTD